MLDVRQLTPTRSSLVDDGRQLDPSLSIGIYRVSGSRRYSLRVRLQDSRLSDTVASARLGIAINSCKRADRWLVARLGPDEWLLLGDENAGSPQEMLSPGLSNGSTSLVDVSHRDAAFLVGGRHAREVINGGCPLDLHDSAFPEASATRTVLGKSEIVLIRSGPEEVYRIECARSFAPYVCGLLEDVAREFGASDLIAPLGRADTPK